jgi:hypothetical protein
MENVMVKTGAKIGATIGTIVFFLFGLMPGFYFGGYGAISILYKLTGGAVEPTLISRVAVVMGMLIGVFSMATVSLVVGSLLGSAIGYLVSIPTKKELVSQKN